ncbi:MAG: ABC transporter ATP-binding protein [Planctomycetota bacterium]
MTLAAAGLRVTRGRRTVLAGVDFAVGAGELVLLAGRNGAGKSTLLRALIGLEPPAAGTVTLRDRPVGEWEARARAREVAFVPQNIECPFEFTCRELVAMGRHPHVPRNHALGAADEQAVDEALAAVDATAFADRAITTLSGGEQRRVALARAFATRAPLLLLDEPTANLDLEHALSLLALLRREAAAGRGIVVASHDLNLVAAAGTRAMVLHEGRVAADGRPDEALSAATLRAVFGVQARAPSAYFPRDYGL